MKNVTIKIHCNTMASPLTYNNGLSANLTIALRIAVADPVDLSGLT